MSVTITSSPQLYTPSDNDVIWTFSSNQSGQPNFSFFVEVYVNGALHSTHLIFPEVGGNKAHFNGSEIARNICSVPPVNSSVFSQDAGDYIAMSIDVYERYGDPPTLQANTASTTMFPFKSCLSDENFVNWDYTDYAFASTKKWLTLWPRNEKYLCGVDEDLFMMFINNLIEIDVSVILYDESGTVITTELISTASTTSNRILINNFSPAAISANSPIDISDFDNCAYYTLQMTDGVNDSELFTVWIDRTCDVYGTKRLHYLTSIGSIDAFSFTKANEESREIQSQTYETQFGGWDGSNDYVFDLGTGRENDFIKTSKGKMKVSSDWLREDVQNYLCEELYHSPYVQLEGDTYKRMRVLNTSYRKQKDIYGELFQEIVELGMTDNRKSALV